MRGHTEVHTMMTKAARDYRRFERLAESADRGLRTRLEGWTVGDLIDHVAWGAAMEAASVRAAAGAPTGSPDSGLAGAVTAFADVVGLDVPAATPVALAAGTVPMGYAAPLFAFEAALHLRDLEHALTGAEHPLDAEDLAACAVVLGPMLDLVAGAVPSGDPVVLDLLGDGQQIRLKGQGSSGLGEPGDALRLPPPQKRVIKTKIPTTPANKHRRIPKQRQLCFDFRQHRMRRMP